MEVELFCAYGQTDRTARHDKANSCFFQFCECGYLQYLFFVHELYTSHQDSSSSTAGTRLLASCWCRGVKWQSGKRGNTACTQQAFFFVSKTFTVKAALNVLPAGGLFWNRYNVAWAFQDVHSWSCVLASCSYAHWFGTRLASYEGHLESKERFAIKKYLLIIGKKKNMQVLSHTFTYFST